jgi:hypothetical protein
MLRGELLTLNPLFRTIINAFDIVPRPIWVESPDTNHLCVRVGVGRSRAAPADPYLQAIARASERV